MGRTVIVAYRPKAGREGELMAAVRKHLAVLRRENLATDRPSQVMRAADGTVVEVFEWQSTEAIARAHANPEVQALWREFDEACDFVPLAALAEANQPFAEFDSLTL